MMEHGSKTHANFDVIELNC